MVKKEQLRKLIKKSLLVGVGIAAYAQEVRKKAEKVVKELVKKEGLNPKEGKKLVKVIYKEANKSRKRVTSVVEKELKGLLKTTIKSSKKFKKKPVRKKTVKKKQAKKKKKK